MVLAKKSPRRPLRGVRLNYEVPLDGGTVLVRIKESIGEWLGLKVARGDNDTGVFGNTVGVGEIQISTPGLNSNNGKKYLLPPAGFRFQSFIFLVKPGTVIAEPVANCTEGKTEQRPICTFSIGFPKGPKETRITRWRIKKWIRSSKRSKSIYGMITPSGSKHVWDKSTSNTPQLPGGADNLLERAADAAGALGIDSLDDAVAVGKLLFGTLF